MDDESLFANLITIDAVTGAGLMINLAVAFAAPPEGAEAGGSLLSLLPPMIMMFLIFYFILIRPQQKKQQELQKMVDSLKEGDNIVTHSGFHGVVKKVKDDIVFLQIADNVRVKVNRSSIGTIKQDAGNAKKDEI